jgi:hypothetical protein
VSSHIELLEEFLRTAPIIYQGVWPIGGAHQNKMELILEGGVAAIAKPADWPDGPRTVQCEVAAWEVAKVLGWPDLLAATVRREVRSPASSEPVDAAVQIAWARPMPDTNAPFSDNDTWRAAVFDLVIDHSDRGGHNWLAVPSDAATPQLKLVDHGYAFGAPGRPFQSTFFDKWRGQTLPEDVKADLEALLAAPPQRGLETLLPTGEYSKMMERVQALVAAGILDR